MIPFDTVGGVIILIAVGIVLIAAVHGAIQLRKRLRELGEVLAKQSEQKEWGPPDPGNPHEDTKANRDEDPQ